MNAFAQSTLAAARRAAAECRKKLEEAADAPVHTTPEQASRHWRAICAALVWAEKCQRELAAVEELEAQTEEASGGR